MSRSLDSILSAYEKATNGLNKPNKKQTKRKAVTSKKSKASTKSKKAASGMLNDLINSLPYELHIPGYNYLGPGTKYDERVHGQYGDDYQVPINALDVAAMMHDKAYKQTDIASRTKADKKLRQEAQVVYKNPSNKWSERATALAVDNIFALKNFVGAGTKNKAPAKRKYTKKTKPVEYSNDNNYYNDNNNIMSAGYCNDPVTISELYDEESSNDDNDDDASEDNNNNY